MMKIESKICFSVKKFISTSEQNAEHLFAGQNTQQSDTGLTLIVIFLVFIQYV